jgi:hypothetical protein
MQEDPKVIAPAPTPQPDPPPADQQPQPDPGVTPENQPDAPPDGTPAPDDEGEPPGPDPLIQAMLRDLKGDSAEPEIKPVPDEPPTSAEPPPAAPAAAPVPDPPPAPTAAPPARKKRVSIVPDLEVQSQPAPTATPAPPPPPAAAPEPPPADPDEAYVQGLTDEQREELMEAAVAERLFPDRYRGRRKALINWYRGFDGQVQQLMTSDPNRKLDDSDEEFQRVVKTKPSLLPAHSKKVQRTIGEEEAVQRVQQNMNPQLEEIKRRQDEIDYQPKADRLVSQFQNGVQELVMSDDKSEVGKALREINATPEPKDGKWVLAGKTFDTEAAAASYKADVGKAFKLEQAITQDEVNRASKLTREYLMFDKRLRKFDETNPLHVDLVNFVNQHGEEFARNGGDLRNRGGRTFLPRVQYVALARSNPDALAQHWTWDTREIVDLLAYDAKARIENRVKQAIQIAQMHGFERPKPGAASQPTATPSPPAAKKEPTSIQPPRATPKAAGSAVAAQGAEPISNTVLTPTEVSNTLGFRRAASLSTA